MFSKIMVPVDLAHVEDLARALTAAGQLAKEHDAEVCYVGVTAATPGPVAHNPQEYAAKLEAFARAQGEAHGVRVTSKSIVAHDPAVELDSKLLKAVEETGADLVVMGTHKPGLAEYLWPSNGGAIATHSAASVFLVR